MQAQICPTYFGERWDEDPEGDDEGQLHPLELHVEHLGRGDSIDILEMSRNLSLIMFTLYSTRIQGRKSAAI